MAATSIASILAQVRAQLVEPTARFWTDAELIAIMNLGAQDLWGAILDLHQDHYFRINEANVILHSGYTELSGVPADCFRVRLIEARDTTPSGTGRNVEFIPRKYNHPDFISSRAAGTTGSTSPIICFQIVGEGAPAGAPRIVIAPAISFELPLRLVYNPTIEVLADGTGINPVPGSSDNALKAWTLAYARAKETSEHTPDTGWLTIYATEKQLILTRLTPREEQEPEVVDSFLFT